MTLWVYNDNSYNHRGVWHVATKPFEKILVPERIDRIKRKIYVNHAYDCRMNGYWSRESKRCTCSAGVDSFENGEYLSITIFPEHEKWQTIRVLCNQVQFEKFPRTRFDGPRPTSYEDGGVYESTCTYGPLGDTPDDLYTYEGVKPPGPVCSRCLKKVNAAQ